MDAIFDADVDNVGGEIEAYCPNARCKADTTHTVVDIYENEIRRVRCLTCSEVHAYRKPRRDAAEDPPPPRTARKRTVRKPTWAEAMAKVTGADLASARPYSIRDSYQEFDIVSHPTFGVGFVTELLPDHKVEITFSDEARVLVHDRSDLAAKMPALSTATAEKRGKSRRKKRQPSPLAAHFRGLAREDGSRAGKASGNGRGSSLQKRDSIRLAVEQIRKRRAASQGDAEALEQAQMADTQTKVEIAKKAAAEKMARSQSSGRKRKRSARHRAQPDSTSAASPELSGSSPSIPLVQSGPSADS